MNNNSGFANNALNSRTIEADEIYTGNLTATTTTSTIQDFTDLTTDSVNEKTSGAGVTVDGVLLKDGLVDSVDVSALKTDVDGFPDELKSLTADEINQLANIGTCTVSATQWGYLGATDQGLATTDDVTFNNISVTGTVDVAALKTDVDGFPDSLKNINQELTKTSNVNFKKIEIAADSNIHFGSTSENSRIAGNNTNISINASSLIELNGNTTLNGNLTVSGTVDGVDVSALNTTVGTIQTDLNGFPDIYEGVGLVGHTGASLLRVQFNK
eukprot:CAMPEP_0117440968 /NCGR_PEP_ID=MMETSP0759-20121206/3374_1 /TAXON_ID=63605 /ORGANISM="Percolomonas cosmopolitus, Strain WS" /LENGTH=270 /DNA_ID=CAMNT_0005232771 /DNA_START=1006 /DNA_END=1818 /DNA_ORIENTATION=-